MTTFIALLRGVNVGGNNIIKMTELKECLEKLGLMKVTTYIQSGNVLFQTSTSAKDLREQIERALSKKFNYKSCVVVVSQAQLKRIIEQAPSGFGQSPDIYRYDVIFLRAPITPKDVIKTVKAKEGVDNVHMGKYVLYFSRLISRATQSHLPKIIQTPFYQQMTIRNWNTTQKLLMLVKGS